jgi:hypothetical protein
VSKNEQVATHPLLCLIHVHLRLLKLLEITVHTAAAAAAAAAAKVNKWDNA